VVSIVSVEFLIDIVDLKFAVNIISSSTYHVVHFLTPNTEQ